MDKDNITITDETGNSMSFTNVVRDSKSFSGAEQEFKKWKDEGYPSYFFLSFNQQNLIDGGAQRRLKYG